LTKTSQTVFGLDRAMARDCGFTLLEFVVAITIVVALMAIAIPQVASYKAQGDISRAINDLRVLDNQIKSYQMSNDVYPAALSDVPQGNLLDPWGHSYQYLKIEGVNIKGNGQVRKDKNLIPINSDFDLYSMGPDGQSVGPITAAQSQDDIIRANNGGYFGVASNY